MGSVKPAGTWTGSHWGVPGAHFLICTVESVLYLKSRTLPKLSETVWSPTKGTFVAVIKTWPHNLTGQPQWLQ